MAKYSKIDQFMGLLNNANRPGSMKRPNIFLVFGDDPFIRTQIVSAIKSHFKSSGFTEFLYYNGDNFSWDDLENNLVSFGLFANQRFISIDVTEKVPKELTANIKTVCSSADDDLIVLIYGKHLTGTQEKLKWFSELFTNPKTEYLSYYPPKTNELPRWYYEQALKLKISLDPKAQYYLAANFEGNLAAGFQVLYNLKLQGIQGNVSVEQLEKQVIAENHFNSDELFSALAEKNSAKALRIIRTMHDEHVDLKKILYSVHQVLCLILEFKLSNSANFDAVFEKYYGKLKLFDLKRNITAMAANIPQYQLKHLENLISLFTRIDKSVINENFGWELLETFVVGFNNPAFLDKFEPYE